MVVDKFFNKAKIVAFLFFTFFINFIYASEYVIIKGFREGGPFYLKPPELFLFTSPDGGIYSARLSKAGLYLSPDMVCVWNHSINKNNKYVELISAHSKQPCNAPPFSFTKDTELRIEVVDYDLENTYTVKMNGRDLFLQKNKIPIHEFIADPSKKEGREKNQKIRKDAEKKQKEAFDKIKQQEAIVQSGKDYFRTYISSNPVFELFRMRINDCVYQRSLSCLYLESSIEKISLEDWFVKRCREGHLYSGEWVYFCKDATETRKYDGDLYRAIYKEIKYKLDPRFDQFMYKEFWQLLEGCFPSSSTLANGYIPIENINLPDDQKVYFLEIKNKYGGKEGECHVQKVKIGKEERFILKDFVVFQNANRPLNVYRQIQAP